MTRSDLILATASIAEIGHATPEEFALVAKALESAWDELDGLRVDLARARGEPVETLREYYTHVGPLPDSSVPF